MTNYRPLRRNRISGQFSARTIEMMEAPGWSVLSRAARLVLDRIEIEHAHHGGNDNGRLPVTFDHFVEFGVHRHSIGPALRELCALGYIEVTEHGQAGNGEWRRPNRFRLTYRPVGNAKPTDEWRRIKTEQDAELTARNARAPAHRSDGKRTTKKQKTSDGLRQKPGEANRHRKSKTPVTESASLAMVRIPSLPLYSRVSVARQHLRGEHVAPR